MNNDEEKLPPSKKFDPRSSGERVEQEIREANQQREEAELAAAAGVPPVQLPLPAATGVPPVPISSQTATGALPLPISSPPASGTIGVHGTNSNTSSQFIETPQESEGSPIDWAVIGSQGRGHAQGHLKEVAQRKDTGANRDIQGRLGVSKVSGTDVREYASQQKGEGAQFNAPWCGLMNYAKKSTCYICGCEIKEKEVRGGKKVSGHSPEMEHVIVPGEFFMKFGTEFVAYPRKIIETPGTKEEYHLIHEDGSDDNVYFKDEKKVTLKDRIELVKNFLDLKVTSDRVKSKLTFPAKQEYPPGADKSVEYDKDFFVPQIKSYMVQFAYAHHICNQIKGHMPVLEGSDGLEFSETGEYIPNRFTGTIERYAEILVDVVRKINKNKNAKIIRGKTETGSYYENFNDGSVCYIAAPKIKEYGAEIPDIYNCWFGNGKGKPSGEQILNIKTRIIKNMLYHSALLRMTRRECTLQRLKNPYYIRRFTTLIPDNINADGLSYLTAASVNQPIIDDDLVSVQSNYDEVYGEDENTCGDLHRDIEGEEEGKEEEVKEEGEGEGRNPIFEKSDEAKEAIAANNTPTDHRAKKKELYKLIGLQVPEQRVIAVEDLKNFLEIKKSGYIADLIASNVIYKAHQVMKEATPTEKTGTGGGKRTKRRRGRGKSKKKVTRKKRVKRRKTVKKIKRKRRTTRKR